MALSQEFITGLVLDFQEALPCRISRIEGGDTWAALKLSGDSWLLLSWDAKSSGCCIANQSEISALKNISQNHSSIIEALKSRFTKSEILAIRQLNRDRLIEFQIQRRVSAGLGVNYFLILEATSPTANLLILDESHKIEEAVRHSTPDQNSFRTILPGQLYNTPPIFNGIEPNSIQALNLNYEDVLNLKGIGRPLAKLIQNHWDELPPAKWLSKILSSTASRIITKNNYLTRFDYDFPETQILNQTPIHAAKFAVLNPLLEKYRSKKLSEIAAKLKRAVKSRERHKDGLLKQLNDCKSAEIFRQKGEAILANIHAIKPYSTEAKLTDWQGNLLNIALDPNLSASRNAEKYFRKYRKSQINASARQEITKNLEAINLAITELNEQLELLASLKNPDEFQKAADDLSEWLAPQNSESGSGSARKSKSRGKKSSREIPPHSIFEKNGVTILVGLSARGNRFVTFKQAHSDDIWLHAHEVPGAHVIIKNISRDELENSQNEILKFAASLAASHSTAKSANSVLVDYTERKYVRSVPGTMALVTYTNPGTIRISPSMEY